MLPSIETKASIPVVPKDAFGLKSVPSESICGLVGKKDLDLINPTNCEKYVEDFCPDILINLAAYTEVEKSEKDYENARKIRTQQ